MLPASRDVAGGSSPRNVVYIVWVGKSPIAKPDSIWHVCVDSPIQLTDTNQPYWPIDRVDDPVHSVCGSISGTLRRGISWDRPTRLIDRLCLECIEGLADAYARDD